MRKPQIPSISVIPFQCTNCETAPPYNNKTWTLRQYNQKRQWDAGMTLL